MRKVFLELAKKEIGTMGRNHSKMELPYVQDA